MLDRDRLVGLLSISDVGRALAGKGERGRSTRFDGNGGRANG